MNRVRDLYHEKVNSLNTTDDAIQHHKNFWKGAPTDEDEQVAEDLLAEAWLETSHVAWLAAQRQAKAHA